MGDGACAWERHCFGDADGRRSTTAVAASPNGKQLAELLHEGVEIEVHSWEMDDEEPTAASIISHALNKAHELSLRTTELTAPSALKGATMLEMGLSLIHI